MAVTEHLSSGDLTLMGWIIYVFPCRTEQLYQNVLALWHHSHINMKSVVSWHYLMADIRAIRNWNVASVRSNYYAFLFRSHFSPPVDDHLWWSGSVFDDHSKNKVLVYLIFTLISLTTADKDHVTRWASAGLEQSAVPLGRVLGRQRRIRGVHSGRLCPARERRCGLQGVLPGTAQICRKRQGSHSLPVPPSKERWCTLNTSWGKRMALKPFKPFGMMFFYNWIKRRRGEERWLALLWMKRKHWNVVNLLLWVLVGYLQKKKIRKHVVLCCNVT